MKQIKRSHNKQNTAWYVTAVQRQKVEYVVELAK